MASPKVSIVVVNWNGFDVTRECLASLAAIDYTNYEVVLVDNGSADGSADKLAAEFPDTIVLRNRENLGFTGGNNVGMRCALERGTDYILLLNNDTVAAPNFLTELISVAESDERIGILNPKIYYFDPPTKLWYAGGVYIPWIGIGTHIGAGKSDHPRYSKMKDVSFVTGCAFLIKAAVIREIGLLDERFFYTSEDTDWSIRAIRAGYRALYVPASVIWHKQSYDVKRNAGKSFRDYYNIRNIILLARKHARPYHWPTLAISLGAMLAYRTMGYTVRGEFERIQALYKGVWAGVRFLEPSTGSGAS
jgi:GT2 family glycosyltransferase